MGRISRLAGIASGALFLTLGVANAAQYKFDLADEYSATGPTGEAEAFFADMVKKNSNGQIEITAHLDTRGVTCHRVASVFSANKGDRTWDASVDWRALPRAHSS